MDLMSGANWPVSQRTWGQRSGCFWNDVRG
jgi:hypothetical protein